DPSTVYATVDGTHGAGVARSTDGGATWHRTRGSRAFGGSRVASLAFDSQVDGLLLAATLDGRVFATLDRGASWRQRGSSPGTFSVQSLVAGRGRALYLSDG